MDTADPDSIADLIDDCTDIPKTVLGSSAVPPPRRPAAGWIVDDTNLAQVRDLDEYV